MRQIGKLENAVLANRLVDYLKTRHIDATAEPSGRQWAVWIRDEDHLEEALEEYGRFLDDPDDKAYTEAATRAVRLRQTEAQRRRQAAENVIDVRRQWRSPTARSAPLTIVLIILSVAVGMLTKFGTDHNSVYNQLTFFDPANIKAPGVDSPDNATRHPMVDILQGQVWRLVTSIFIHYGIMHLVFNMYMFYQFGTLVESRRGTVVLALLVLAIAVLSNMGEVYAGVYRGIPVLAGGMSGVIYGLFGYVWMQAKFVPGSGFRIDQGTVFILVVWFFLGVFGILDSLLNVHIANWAHGVGLVVGMAIGYLPALWQPRPK